MRWSLLTVAILVAVVGGCGGCFDRSQQPPPPTGRRIDPTPPPPEPEAKIRKAVMAGSWYFAEREKLIPYLDAIFAKAEAPKVDGKVVALISPHAGYTFSGKAAATGYKLLKGRDLRRVIVLALSHHVRFRGASIPLVDAFETPLGRIPLDQAAVARLRRSRLIGAVAEAEEREHSLEIQLPLLQRVLSGFKLVPLLVGELEGKDYAELAGALAELVDEKTVVVASSDFTHRGPNYSFEVPEGKGTLKERLAALDDGAVAPILKRDRAAFVGYVDRTRASICGARPIGLLLELLARFPGLKGQVVSRYTSGDVTGAWDSTVSYVDVAFTGAFPAASKLDEARSAGEKVFPLTAEEKQTLLKLARRSLEAAVKRGDYDPSVASATASPSLQRKAGAFVTLKCKHGQDAVCVGHGDDLRGCIGTILPIDGVRDTVARRAASAALEDTRFPHKVSAAELRHITVEVSVLTPPRAVKGPAEIIIGRHGIILTKDGRSATFLPQVAPEQGWDRETTLRHLAHKAGLDADDWRSATYQVYEAIVFTEGE